jgi:hypothetical protein
VLKNWRERGPGEEGMVTYQVGPFLTDINFIVRSLFVNGSAELLLSTRLVQYQLVL